MEEHRRTPPRCSSGAPRAFPAVLPRLLPLRDRRLRAGQDPGARSRPPTVERTIDGRTGSLQLWIEGAFTELDRRERGLEATDGIAWSNRIYSLRLLHQLTYNDDAANLRNVIYDPEFRAYAIDNSRSFRSYRALADPSGLRRFSRALIERLGELGEPELSRRLGPWLSRGQIEALLARRDRIVGRAERLAASIGEDAAYY